MKEKQIQDDLASIRNLMERSSKFISLSGLSGILAGVYALIGAAYAYHLIYDNFLSEIKRHIYLNNIITEIPQFNRYEYQIFPSSLLFTAFFVLIASISTGIILSIRKAKRKGHQIWGTTSRLLLFNMAVPLVSGGILILLFVNRGFYGIAAPAMLIFYGISLVSAGNFTFNDVKYLGLSEIFLGIFAACLPGYGLLFWAIGFGVLHIIYGSLMYLKYDR